jgi:hypothetical protein
VHLFGRTMDDRRRDVSLDLIWTNMPLLPRWKKHDFIANCVTYGFRWGPLLVIVVDYFGNWPAP